jgi:hypothetical protein
VTPVLRPHFLSRRQYTNLVRSAEALASAIDRVKRLALSTPALLQKMELLPGEKMLAQLDPGYARTSVACLLDTQVNNGSMRVLGAPATLPLGVALGEALADLFYEQAPMKEFRKKVAVSKCGGAKPLISAMLKAYKEFGGKGKPGVAFLELRQPFRTAETLELDLLAAAFQRAGYEARVVTPEQLEYRDGRLRAAEQPVNLLFRCVRAHEFLLRFDLNHALVRAYRDGAVCVVNSFQSELGRQRSLFHLLTDDAVTASFPAEERKAIRENVPWTRIVTAGRTTWQDQTVDLPEFILRNREKLALRPNDDGQELPEVDGASSGEAGWDRAVRMALRNPYVVQERVEICTVPFPVDVYGEMAMRDMVVDVQPQSFLGKVQGCGSRVAPAYGASAALSGLAPAFVVEPR